MDPDPMEELLRRSLDARAQDVRPNPQTWQQVSRRVTRAQRMRWALAGATGFAALALAALVVPSLLNDSDVRFDDDPPAALTGPAPTEIQRAVGGGGACGGPEHVAAVFARSLSGLRGTLWAFCDDGSESLLATPDAAELRHNPAFAPDGSAIVYQSSDAEGVDTLVHLDLATGQEQVIGGGALPAFAPDGRLAWVQHVDGGQDLILIGEPFSEPEMEFPVVDGEDGESFDVRRLAWDANGQTLYAEAGYEESVLFAFDPDTGEGRRVEEPIAEERYAGPSTAPEGLGVAVLARCCLDTDGQAFDHADLRLVDSDDARLLNQMPEDFDADGPVWTAYAPMGELRQVEGTGLSWSGGTRAAWLVGDGDGLWIVEGDGTVHAMGLKVTSAAANPALSAGGPGPRPEGMAPGQEGLAHDAGVTRQGLWEAAEARDYDALRAYMGEEFTASFGGGGADEAITMLRDMEQRGEDPFALIQKLLAMPYAAQQREGGPSPIYTWPSVFAKAAEEWTEQDEAQLRELGTAEEIEDWRQFGGYIGRRIGIDAAGSWLYLVAGD